MRLKLEAARQEKTIGALVAEKLTKNNQGQNGPK